jgi:hypothetical protein
MAEFVYDRETRKRKEEDDTWDHMSFSARINLGCLIQVVLLESIARYR